MKNSQTVISSITDQPDLIIIHATRPNTHFLAENLALVPTGRCQAIGYYWKRKGAVTPILASGSRMEHLEYKIMIAGFVFSVGVHTVLCLQNEFPTYISIPTNNSEGQLSPSAIIEGKQTEQNCNYLLCHIYFLVNY